MERRLHNVVTQRDSLSAALDEATDRIMMLEKTTREQESQVGECIEVVVLFVPFCPSKLVFVILKSGELFIGNEEHF